jgi:hypothetical protein
VKYPNGNNFVTSTPPVGIRPCHKIDPRIDIRVDSTIISRHDNAFRIHPSRLIWDAGQCRAQNGSRSEQHGFVDSRDNSSRSGAISFALGHLRRGSQLFTCRVCCLSGYHRMKMSILLIESNRICTLYINPTMQPFFFYFDL